MFGPAQAGVQADPTLASARGRSLLAGEATRLHANERGPNDDHVRQRCCCRL
jgi:hypothetical protein